MGVLLLVLAVFTCGSYFYQAPQVVDGTGEVLYRDVDGDYRLLLGYPDSRDMPVPARVETVEPGIQYFVPVNLFINPMDGGKDVNMGFLQKIERITTELIQPADSASPMTCTEPTSAGSSLQPTLRSGVSFTSQSGTAEFLWTLYMKNGDKILLRQTYTAQPKEPERSAKGVRHISTSTDEGRFFLELAEDENGNCTVTRDRLQAEFPEIMYFSLSGAPSLAGDLDDYLSDTYHMSRLVATGGTGGGNDQYGSFYAKNDSDSTQCLFLYSDLTTLCGYAVGPPQEVTEGIWRLEVTHCDYDFSALYRERAGAFAAAETPPYISPTELSASGAEWFLSAFNMQVDTAESKNTQLFYLWNQSVSPYFDYHLRAMDTLSKWLPRGNQNNPRYMYYYLFDKDQTLIGYTRLSSGDATGGYSDGNHQVLDGAGEVTYSDADGTYQLLLSFVDTRNKPLPERVDYAELDSNGRVPSCLFINLKDSGADATQGFMQKVERVTTEFIQPADSVRPMTCSEPTYSDAFPAAAMISSITFTGRSSPAELVWTIEMKNGDKILLRQKYTVNPIETFEYRPEDVAMNTMGELQALVNEIEQTVDKTAVVKIYLPPVTYVGGLVLTDRAIRFYGSEEDGKKTTFTETVRITGKNGWIYNFHDINFIGSGAGIGISCNARLHIINCTVSGWKTGLLGYGNAWVNLSDSRFEQNGVGFHFNSADGNVSDTRYRGNNFLNNETAVLLESVPSDVAMDFGDCLFSGNGKDIENLCDQPIDISEAVFE